MSSSWIFSLVLALKLPCFTPKKNTMHSSWEKYISILCFAYNLLAPHGWCTFQEVGPVSRFDYFFWRKPEPIRMAVIQHLFPPPRNKKKNPSKWISNPDFDPPKKIAPKDRCGWKRWIADIDAGKYVACCELNTAQSTRVLGRAELPSQRHRSGKRAGQRLFGMHLAETRPVCCGIALLLFCFRIRVEHGMKTD